MWFDIFASRILHNIVEIHERTIKTAAATPHAIIPPTLVAAPRLTIAFPFILFYYRRVFFEK
jgi:hypothetical protein